MSNAQIWANVATSLEDVQQYQRERPQREARLAEAKASQGLAEAKLAEHTATAPTRKTQAEVELAAAQSQLRATQAESLKNNTYNAFRMYEADGSTRHLNVFLEGAKKNPVGNRVWGEYARFDTLQRTPEVEAQLAQAGITDLDEFFADPALVQGKVLATNIHGQQQVMDMDKLYQGTGFTKYMTQQELAAQQERAQLDQLMRGQMSSETNLIAKIKEEEPELTWREATAKYYEIKNQGKGGSKVERVADDIQAADPTVSREAALLKATQTVEPRTAAQKNLGAAVTARAAIDETAGGDFFEADLNDPTLRRKIGPRITELEKLTGKSLTTEDKRVARSLRSLAALGAVAGENITDAEAGPLDSLLRGFKKYVSNDVTSIEGTAAYETFRNVFRNALYGASLTKSEIGVFTAAAGSLKQQAGPVLQQLLVQVGEIKAQLQSIYDLNDEYVAQYYLGRSLEDIDVALEALDERVELFKSAPALEEQAKAMRVPTAPIGARPSLDSIFGD